MKKRLDEGVWEDIEGLRSIHWAISSENGRHLPYVRIERKDGSELHVHAADESLRDRREAVRLAKELAEEMIKVATDSASGS